MGGDCWLSRVHVFLFEQSPIAFLQRSWAVLMVPFSEEMDLNVAVSLPCTDCIVWFYSSLLGKVSLAFWCLLLQASLYLQALKTLPVPGRRSGIPNWCPHILGCSRSPAFWPIPSPFLLSSGQAKSEGWVPSNLVGRRLFCKGILTVER